MVVVLGAVFGLLGPFGTYAMPAPLRLAYWISFGFFGYAIFRPVGIVGDWAARTMGFPRLIGLLIADAVAALPMTLLVAFAIGGMRWRALAAVDLGQLYLQVLLLGLVVNGLMHLLFKRGEQADAEPASGPAAAPVARPAPFLDRLPPAIGRDLVALQMEDHYVRAHTMAGNTLILLRLRDAIAELAPIEGAQPHRSWWIARAHVTGVERNGRSIGLRLANGLVAPVARDQAATLRAQGWFDQ